LSILNAVQKIFSMVHRSVLFSEALQHLAIKENGRYIDCTFGRGGHSIGILARLGPEGLLLALDRDRTAIDSEVAHVLLEDRRFSLKQACFSELERLVAQEGWQNGVDGILLDLGVSSPQLDNAERGFSFLREGPLDMRMDRHGGISAAHWLAEVSEKKLADILFHYGEERFAKRIARAIIEKRAVSPLTTTRQLAALVESAVPHKDKHKHVATRTFQAIRIEVNQELAELQAVLNQSIRLLGAGGRLVVIAFHSLEDRLVKRFIKEQSGRIYRPEKLPMHTAGAEPVNLKKIGRVIKPGAEETAANPRARSAIMRVAEKA
jgi:16S rRNA (cytosine1402-N4)-methyltransferase